MIFLSGIDDPIHVVHAQTLQQHSRDVLQPINRKPKFMGDGHRMSDKQLQLC
jgi:hypothetical protein